MSASVKYPSLKGVVDKVTAFLVSFHCFSFLLLSVPLRFNLILFLSSSSSSSSSCPRVSVPASTLAVALLVLL